MTMLLPNHANDNEFDKNWLRAYHKEVKKKKKKKWKETENKNNNNNNKKADNYFFECLHSFHVGFSLR